MYYVIYNPISGNGNGEKAALKVIDILKDKCIEFKAFPTQHPGHATLLAQQAVSDRADAVIGIGGDGTVSGLVRGLARTNTPLGIIGAGTGNDFIKTAGIPKDIDAAIELILNGTPKDTDACLINDRPFINECGTGFDVMVLDYAEKAKKHVKGLLPYLWGVIRTIIHFKSVKVTYSIDDQAEKTEDLLVFAAGNGGIIGGGIPMCPGAKIDDGLFTIVIVKSVKKYKMPFYLVRLLKGKVCSFKETVSLSGKKITFSCPEMRVNVDGEIIPMDKAEIELIPDAIRIYR